MQRERVADPKRCQATRAHDDQDEDRNPHGQCAHVVQPLADVEANDVQQRRERQREQRENNVKGRRRLERCPQELCRM